MQLQVVDDAIKENTQQYFGGVLEFSEDCIGADLGTSNVLLTIIDDDSK